MPQDEPQGPGRRIPRSQVAGWKPPPIFLAHGGADIISPLEHSVLMYLALKRAGIPTELHVYAGAAHDFDVRKLDHPCSTWTARCMDWLRSQGFLGPSRDEENGPVTSELKGGQAAEVTLKAK
jgi:acetyl esterase/lipase